MASLFTPQILTIVRCRSGHDLSILSLGLQIPVLFLLSLAVARRIEFRKREPRPGSEDSYGFGRVVEGLRERGRNAVVRYFCGGNVAVGYGVMACGQGVLFALCLWFWKGGGGIEENL